MVSFDSREWLTSRHVRYEKERLFLRTIFPVSVGDRYGKWKREVRAAAGINRHPCFGLFSTGCICAVHVKLTPGRSSRR